MLVNAGVRTGGGPLRQSGMNAAAATERGCWLQPGMLRNLDSGWAAISETDEANAYPNGYRHPSAWVLATKTGAAASRFQAGGSSSLSGTGAMGVNVRATLPGIGTLLGDITYILFVEAGATLTGVGVVSADGSYITFVNIGASLSGLGDLTSDATYNTVVQLQALLAGAGDLTADAAYLAFLDIAATLTGSSDLTATGYRAVNRSADLTGSGYLTATGFVTKEAAATLAGTSDVAANLRSLGELVASIVSTGSLTAGSYAHGEMSAELSLNAGVLTPASIARSVWESVAADFTDTGTFGGQARFSYLLAHNKTVTDPVAGTITVYDVDGTTVLFVADLYEDASGTTPYQGRGADRRDSF